MACMRDVWIVSNVYLPELLWFYIRRLLYILPILKSTN